MLHFFARLGRKPLAKLVVPLLGATTSVGYLAFHFHGHNIAVNLLAAQSESGKREEIAKELQDMVNKVYREIQDSFCVPILKLVDKPPPPTIRWFSTASLEPVTIGMTESASGVTIGLPNYFNYNKAEDLPQNYFHIRRLNIFKTFGNKKEERYDEISSGGEETVNLTCIDKDSPDGKLYTDSLILSEKAKEFVIARELFLSDSYKPLLMSSVILLSFLLSLALSRTAVSRFKLADAHLSQRLTVYGAFGLVGFVNFMMLSDSAHTFFTRESDKKAIAVGESYKEGAIEYFSKLIQRNKAIKKLLDDMEWRFDDEGNIRENFLRHKFVPLTERLALAKKAKIIANNKSD